MRVMVMIKATPNSEEGHLPTKELLTAMGEFNEALAEAGVLVSGEGLHPSSRGTRLRMAKGETTVIDGPFAETKELLAGFWIWQVDSMEDAIAWARRCPDPMPGEVAELEIRPIFTEEDFGEAFTPELREQEARLREKLDSKSQP